MGHSIHSTYYHMEIIWDIQYTVHMDTIYIMYSTYTAIWTQYTVCIVHTLLYRHNIQYV